MKIKIITLGCAKNEVDSEYLASLLVRQGEHSLVEELEQAEAVLVNTCGFIQSAKEEALDVILELVELKKQGKIQKILAVGCLIERYQKELSRELPEVDVFLPLSAYSEVNKILQTNLLPTHSSGFLPQSSMGRLRLENKSYTYLKISEGCNNHCSYCAIPLIRGSLQSRTEEDILAEVVSLANSGVKELIILGQDTTSYGQDIYGEERLTSLLRKIKKLQLFPWLRLMYAHPAHLSESLIDLVAAENILLPYLDLPLQHISERILKKMNRKISQKEIINLINRCRSSIPGLVLRTTFIVGFPSESEAEFQELLSFIKEMRFERLGVFTFSREEGTPAYRFRPQIAENIKMARLDAIMQTQQGISAAYQQSLIGKTLEVLLESQDAKRGRFIGRSYIDAPEVDGIIEVKAEALKIGDLVKVKVTGASIYDLEGEVLAY